MRPVWRKFEVKRILQHTMCGRDGRWLGHGFSDWEQASRTRWAGQVFTLQLSAPESPSPYACQLTLVCWVPENPANTASGDADLYVNRARVARIENAYAKAQRGTPFVVSFWTFGGTLDTTFVFERPFPPLNPADRRELSVVVLAFELKGSVGQRKASRERRPHPRRGEPHGRA